MESSVVVRLLIAAVAFVLSACLSVREPSPATDAPPPPGHAPVFVSATATYTPEAPSPRLMISRTSVVDPQNIRIWAHAVDSSGTLRTNISSKQWRKLFCQVIDEFQGTARSVEFTLKEMTVATHPPAAFAVVMDHSGSMGEQRAYAIQQVAANLISAKRSLDQLCIIKFDNRAEVEVPLTASTEQLRTGLRRTGLAGFGGLTAIVDAAVAGINELQKSQATYRAVLLLTDGYDNSSKYSVADLVALARAHRVAVCTIGFGYNIDEDYLRNIATATGGIYYRIYSSHEFDPVYRTLYTLLLSYYELGVKLQQFGWHRLKVKLCLPSPAAPQEAEVLINNTPDVGMISLVNVYFDVDKADLTAESKPALDNLEALMKAYPTLVIEIRGHTDSTNRTGDPQYNMRLSQRRAEAVRNALIQRGIQQERIIAVGYGESQPIADNSTPEGRALNRRTEFVIVRK